MNLLSARSISLDSTFKGLSVWNYTNICEYRTFLFLQRKSNFDIDHIVIPYSMSSTRVEKLKYKVRVLPVLLTYLLHKEIFTCVVCRT
jgi:hypothetical protein